MMRALQIFPSPLWGRSHAACEPLARAWLSARALARRPGVAWRGTSLATDRVRGGCSRHPMSPLSRLRERGWGRGRSSSSRGRNEQGGSVRLPVAGLLLFACPKRSSQEKRHPAPARGGRPRIKSGAGSARRVPCGARRSPAARQLGRPWPQTVRLSPAIGSAPRRRRGAPVKGAAILAAFVQRQKQLRLQQHNFARRFA